jgi:hypothetical protein
MSTDDHTRTFSSVFDQAFENVHDLAAAIGTVSAALGDIPPADRDQADRAWFHHWAREKLARLEDQLSELYQLHGREVRALEQPEPEMDQAEMEEAARGLKMAIDNAISRRAAAG